MLTFRISIGPINAIVLSRAGESDNVYIRDEQSIAQNGLCEIKIVDNQIMNFNDRSDYLQGLLSALGGIEYYINDFESLGILYYDVGDYYNVQIGENTYKCLMLNSEINVTSGLKEIIHTDLPEQSETDYTKADKTDRRINQTYIIVDKQNQTIESVVNNVGEQNTKISQLTQTVDDISSKISDIADITTYGESSYASVQLDGVNESEPIMIKVHPTTTNISYLYPRNNLYPSDDLYMPTRTIRFTRTYEEDGETLTENIDYELPDDLLIYDSETFDEFYLDYESQTCQITKRCKYNADGTTSALETEVVNTYDYPEILLGEGDYTVSILNTQYGYIFVRLMAKNIYTSQFYTKVETNSLINQTASSIDLSVNQKLSNYSNTTQMNSAINLKANQITSQVSETYETKNNATTNYSRLTQTANSLQSQINANDEDISIINQTVSGVQIEVGKKYNTNDFTNAKITAKINDGTSSVKISANKIDLAGKTINMTSDDIAITSTNFSVDKNGTMSCSNANITGGKINVKGSGSATDLIRVTDSSYSGSFSYMQPRGAGFVYGSANNSVYIMAGSTSIVDVSDNYGSSSMAGSYVRTPQVIQTSKESIKKNIKKYDKIASDIIKNSEIYEYNFKTEKDTDKKHIGFVIGDKGGNYKIPEEVIFSNGEGIDTYTMTSILWKGFQEQQEEIQELKRRLEGKENGKN